MIETVSLTHFTEEATPFAFRKQVNNLHWSYFSLDTPILGWESAVWNGKRAQKLGKGKQASVYDA